MKKVLLLLAVTIGIISCGKAVKNKIDSEDAKEVAAGGGDVLIVDTTRSVINWVGSKVGGSHNGTVNLSEGKLTILGDEVTSGSFTLEMNSIKDLDLKEGSMNDMLVNHLKSADFFNVGVYPTATFTITSIEKALSDSITHIISGNLTLKDTERNITFGAIITHEGNVYTAETVPFTIDRTQWNVEYGSKTLFANLKENIVDDNILLQVKIIAEAAN